MTGFSGLRLALPCALLACAIGAILGGPAAGQDLHERLDRTQDELSKVERRAGVLTTRISHESAQIDRLTVEVADLRNKAAVAAAELAAKQAELEQAQARLDYLRQRLREAIGLLEARLVAIYRSNEPDLITVLLQSEGFDDLLARTEYLQNLQEEDSEIVARVRDLRNEMRATVDAVRAARDVIATRKQQLDATKRKLKSRKVELAAARRAHHATLEDVRTQQEKLEGDLTDLSEKIAEQLAQSSGVLPAGAIRAGSGQLIWPVNGPVVSGFGMRWGRMHEGIDIAVPSGTPIRAAASGTVQIAGSVGGYGLYTCVDHGGGLSTCDGHQSSLGVSVGQQVSQGQIIGVSGCTGHCLGPHVHFEVRIGGQAVDPLGYL